MIGVTRQIDMRLSKRDKGIIFEGRKIFMSYSVKTTKEGIDYNAVSKVLKSFGMSDCDVDTQKKIFQNSYAVSFLYDDDKLIGCARALSDGFCEAALYNIALAEEYHGQGLGRILIESIIEQVKQCNIILYTHPQTIAMYEKFGFRRQKSGMAIYHGNETELQRFEEVGFILPEGYRFHDNEYEE